MLYYLSAGVGPTVAVLPLVLSEALRRHLELSLHSTAAAAASAAQRLSAENHHPENTKDLILADSKGAAGLIGSQNIQLVLSQSGPLHIP